LPRRRAAVVIGVDKTGGGLPSLECSARGADAVAAWLTCEGFEVETITDAKEPVTTQRIFNAITKFVGADNCHQLVVYFSGHGYWKNSAELWLLTNAPGDPNAAVSWVETADYAKDCGIPSVVLISDACRSIPDTPQAMKVRGSIVFPNPKTPANRAKVDKFIAAAEGTAAYEIPIGASKQKESAFTYCFLNAFKSPEADMIKEVVEDGEKIHIVPNRKLAKYLEREVPTLLATVGIVDQRPDAEILSDDDVYVGRAQLPRIAMEEMDVPDARRAEMSSNWLDEDDLLSEERREDDLLSEERRISRPPVVYLRDVAALEVGRVLNQPPPVSIDELPAIEASAAMSRFRDVVGRAGTLADVRHLEAETGLAVLGTQIADAVASDGARLVILARGNRNTPGIVRIEPYGPACSIALRFADGRGAALAGLRGFIAHVMVDSDGVSSVSYVPSVNSVRWDDYNQSRTRIDALRATIAAAARLGVFRLDDNLTAAHVSECIRMWKGLDPSLGLYASYAYSEAGRRNDVESVRQLMCDDLQADLFDVALLASPRGQFSSQRRLVPFCPMLTRIHR
jgi:Caspase domain